MDEWTTIAVKKSIKDLIERLASANHRSMANYLEVTALEAAKELEEPKSAPEPETA